MILPISALFVGVLALWFTWLSITTALLRGKYRAELGEGAVSPDKLQKVVRVHANAAEYIPVLCIIFVLLEYHGTRAEVLYVFGAVILLGRYLHQKALLKNNLRARLWAMQLTIWPMAIGALVLIYTWFAQTFLF